MVNLDCSYHVYNIVDQENSRRSYVADGVGTRSHEYEYVGPISSSDLNGLPRSFVREHLDYLRRQGFETVAKLDDLYMKLLFTPPCEKVFQLGSFYSAYPLNEKEQKRFCNGIKETYKTLEDSINFKNEGIPLDD